MEVTEEFLAGMDRAVFSAWDLPTVASDDPEALAVRVDTIERVAIDGPGYRVKPYPTPLDLLLALNPEYVRTAALETIAEEIRDAAARLREQHARDFPEQLLVNLGPQEGKSSLVVFATALWLLLDDPDRRIIIISYEKEIATRWGRAIRLAIEQHSGDDGGLDLGLRIRRDSRAADRFDLDGHRGGIYCVGIGGAITGRPGDVVLVDDPYRDMKDARSVTVRKRVWDAWRTTVSTRFQPGSLVIVSHTRWHEGDLTGQLGAEQGDQWRTVNIPAKSTGQGDPLGRPAGVWLTSARGRTDRQWAVIERNQGPYNFAALFQGKPSPAEGGLFKRRHFRRWLAVPASTPLGLPVGALEELQVGGVDRWRVQLPGRPLPTSLRTSFRFLTVDLAASTRTSADWTVAGAWAIPTGGELILLDLLRKRLDPEEHWAWIGALAQKWDATVYVEKTQHQTDLVYEAGRAGLPLVGLDADADKFTRAVPAATKMAQGSVFFPTYAEWLDEWESELAEFPNAAHDDQVDVMAYAARVRSAYWTADQVDPREDALRNLRSARRPLPEEVATGLSRRGEVDYERQAW